MKKIISKITVVLFILCFFATNSSQKAYAATTNSGNDISVVASASADDDTLIVVSLGDSYSSGEGIPPFYGQKSGKLFDKSLEERANDERWLAHRSTSSWPGRLVFSGMEDGKTLKDYNVEETTSSKVKWYFKAASGAETKHIFKKEQKKPVKQVIYSGSGVGTVVSYDRKLPKQASVFQGLTGKVDYVTLTIGGNDVGFAYVIELAAKKSTYLGDETLETELNNRWRNVNTTINNIRTVYEEISNAAGPQAHIIVAGYPQLLEKNGKGKLISKAEATMINEKVHDFNKKIYDLVWECKPSMLIDFVDVETKFDNHQAYSKEPWINKIMLLKQSQDLDNTGMGSAYSMHPNDKGAQAYADCVNETIREIEARGILSGKVCKASDRETPIPNAKIFVHEFHESALAPVPSHTYSVNSKTDNQGNYSIELPEGTYDVLIKADGYISFQSFAKVAKKETTYMETFLMVQGSESDKGYCKGRVVNSLAGTGVEGVTLTFRPYWNNTFGSGNIVGTAVTDGNGYYTAELPLGNYTAIATKNGFLESTFNIIVQQGTTENQNGTITPIVSGDDYLITLTWGENPNDLDSHVVGTLSSGDQFHVYYAYQSQYDGDIEVCNLDYDDTTSYGPEHITLKPTSDKPYYYYIHHYAGSGSISTSNAKIKVEKGGVLIRQFNVPTALGTDIYWNVFAIVNGEIVVKNTITPEPDVVYANNRNVSLRTLLASPNDITATEPKDDTEKDETVSDSKDTTSSAESSTPVVTESEASSETESTVSSNEETVSSEDATVSSEVATVSSDETASATGNTQTEDSPVSSSDDTASAAPKVQNQVAAVPAQKEEADDVSPPDTNN